MKIKSFSIETVSIPLKRPFVTALGRKTETRNVIVRLRCSEGIVGYGEASGSLAMAHLTPRELAKTLASLARSAVGHDGADAFGLVHRAWKTCGERRPAAAAFESALWDAWTQSRGLTLGEWLGAKTEKLRTDVTLSAWAPAEAAAAALEAARAGFSTFKVKLTGDAAADIARVNAVAASVPQKKIILDGNQGLSVNGALRLLDVLMRKGLMITLLEQPLAKDDFRGMSALTKRSPVPIAADEMVGSPAEAVRLADERAAHVVNIKLAKSGLLRGLQIAAVARSAGLRLMIGCMMESAPGLSASVHMALGTGSFEFIDLDSDYLLLGGKSARDWKRRGPLVTAA